LYTSQYYVLIRLLCSYIYSKYTFNIHILVFNNRITRFYLRKLRSLPDIIPDPFSIFFIGAQCCVTDFSMLTHLFTSFFYREHLRLQPARRIRSKWPDFHSLRDTCTPECIFLMLRAPGSRSFSPHTHTCH